MALRIADETPNHLVERMFLYTVWVSQSKTCLIFDNSYIVLQKFFKYILCKIRFKKRTRNFIFRNHTVSCAQHLIHIPAIYIQDDFINPWSYGCRAMSYAHIYHIYLPHPFVFVCTVLYLRHTLTQTNPFYQVTE